MMHSLGARLRLNFKRFLADRSASTAVVFAAALIPLLVSAGMAVDYSRAHSAKTALQAIADRAAMYGASQFRGGNPSANVVETKINIFIANALVGRTLSGAAAPTPTIDVDTNTREVGVQLAAAVPTTLMAIANFQSLDVDGSARAAANESPVNVCVLALDPNRIDALYFKGSGQVVAPDCWFWANSAVQSQAMMFQGSFQSTAAGYCTVGDHTIQSALVSPAPQDFCDPVPDPFADWQPPMIPSTCTFGVANGVIVGTTINNGAGTVTLAPGRYCGATNINGADVILQPGRYFFTDGDVSFNTSGDITGEEVYLHFDQTVTKYDVTASTSLRLTARTDSDLRRIAVYKAPVPLGKSKHTMTGNSDVYIDGAVYLPKDDFVLSGNTQVHSVKAKLSVVALGVELQGNVYFEIAPDPDFQAQGSFGAITAVKLLPY